MLLDRIQKHLESIYGIRCELRARDFLLGEEEARALGGTGRAREELLVHEDEGELELGLYLHPEVLEPKDLGAFCEAAEGVSHFVYMTRAADLERKVSLLELEAQAEVDKFALCVLSRWESKRAAGAMFERLFDEVRYREANRLARAYCARLLPMLAARSLEKLLSELRYSYRLGAKAKLDYLSK